MDILSDVSLVKYSTMRLGGRAKYLVEVKSKDELAQAAEWAKSKSLACVVVGIGSNIIWRDEGFDGLVIVNSILGFKVQPATGGDFSIDVGAGEDWDEVVGRCCDMELSGIEALSLIPGKAGATPIQNVGAYGQEIADVLISLEAYDNQDGAFKEILARDCGFGYRTSRFKVHDKGRFFITSLKLQLKKTQMESPFYDILQGYLDEHKISDHSPSSIRRAVIAIRSSRLPDPLEIANTGSFFGNPVVSEDKFLELGDEYGSMPNWPAGEHEVKLSAAWLIENAGLKDFHDPKTGMATWKNQPLVFVNENAKSTADLLSFRDEIIEAVQNKFGVTLVQEPEMMP